MYSLEDAMQGKPMPEEVLRMCSSEIIQICYHTMDRTLDFCNRKIKATEEIIKICEPLTEGKPDREADVQKLRAAVDELILYIHELADQQLRMEKVLEERGEYPRHR